jgi:hypothetical protein
MPFLLLSEYNLGLLLFKSGDYLVVRDKLRGDDFTEDRVVAFQVGRCVIYIYIA